MSRSFKRSPAGGNTTACSDKEHKRRGNRAFRRANRQRVRMGKDPIDVQAVYHQWGEKDGHRWYGHGAMEASDWRK